MTPHQASELGERAAYVAGFIATLCVVGSIAFTLMWACWQVGWLSMVMLICTLSGALFVAASVRQAGLNIADALRTWPVAPNTPRGKRP